MNMVARLYEKEGKASFCFHGYQNELRINEAVIEAIKTDTDVFIAVINDNVAKDLKQFHIKLHILMILGADEREKSLIEEVRSILKEKNIIIINTDDKRIFPFSIGAGSTLITCGLNIKASVTASSVSEDYDLERIQCCIQRTIKTVSGARLEPQEFAVSVSGEVKSVSGVLAAVAAAAAGDTEISQLDCIL